MTRTALVLVVSSLVAVACGRRDNPNPDAGINADANPGANGGTSRRDTALVLGPGDVKIVNEDSSVEMAVVGQRIIARLSDKTMAKVRQETDTAHLKDSGLGGVERRFCPVRCRDRCIVLLTRDLIFRDERL